MRDLVQGDCVGFVESATCCLVSRGGITSKFVVDAMKERIIRVRSRRGTARGRRDEGDVERERERERERDELFSCHRSVGIKGCVLV